MSDSAHEKPSVGRPPARAVGEDTAEPTPPKSARGGLQLRRPDTAAAHDDEIARGRMETGSHTRSDQPPSIPSRRWLLWVAPAVAAALAVLLWYRQIDRAGWCVAEVSDGRNVRITYTPLARWGLVLLSLGAVVAAAVAARAAFARKLDRRHPAVTTCLCVAVAMVLYWLAAIGGVWSDSLVIGPRRFDSNQTHWLVQQRNAIEYARVSKVTMTADKWTVEMYGLPPAELRNTPLLRRAAETLTTRLRRHGAEIVPLRP